MKHFKKVELRFCVVQFGLLLNNDSQTYEFSNSLHIYNNFTIRLKAFIQQFYILEPDQQQF